MSEYVAEIAARYTELMTPAFVEGLQASDSMYNSCPGESYAVFLLQPLIRERLRDANWSESGLPIKEYEGPSDSLKPRDQLPVDYAEKLMVFAFDDAVVLFKLAENFRDRHGLPDGINLHDLLLNSKNTLLLVSRLQDKDKRHIYSYLKYSDVMKLSDSEIVPSVDEAIHLGNDKTGKPRLEWHPAVQEFIDNNLEPERGCPANNVIITTEEGRKQILINYFWDKLVEFAYSGD